LFPKFVTEGAATYHELRKRGTSGGCAGFHFQFKLSSLRIVRQPNEAFSGFEGCGNSHDRAAANPVILPVIMG